MTMREVEKEIRKCSKCAHYSYTKRACKLGKINPPTIKGAVDAMRFMGISYICNFSAVKEKAVARLMKEKEEK